MYIMGTDKYECDFCGFTQDWDGNDDLHGTIWECEHCGKNFCSHCFIAHNGIAEYQMMVRESDKVLCPDCYAKDVDSVRTETRNAVEDFWGVKI